MKNLINKTLIIGTSALLLASCAKMSGSVSLDTPEKKDGYSFGFMMGSEIAKNPNFTTLNKEGFMAGVGDALNKKEGKISEEEMRKLVSAYQQKMSEKRKSESAALSKSNKKKADDFLAQNKTKDGVKTLKSGVQYEVINKGKGRHPTDKDTVKVHYKGMTIDGKVFDSSYERGQPAEFGLGGVIPGWKEVLKTMRVGGKTKAYIPPSQAYGEQGVPGAIEPNSLLIFEIELLSIKK